MKLQFKNSQYDNNMLKFKRQTSGQFKFKEHIIQDNYDKKNMTGPAQAISFSGSAVSLGQSAGQKLGNYFLQSKNINRLIAFVNDNEAAFNAVYALIVAGILKPGLVLTQTGFSDKDGQMIATKNFLQSFVGFFLGMTIGGGFIKKIWDSMSNNFNLIQVVRKDNKITLKTKDAKSEEALEIAKNVLKKEHSGLSAKFKNAKENARMANGLSKVSEFIKNFKKPDYTPSQKEISGKAEELIQNLKTNHLYIFTKNKRTVEYTAKLIENLEFIKVNPTSAKHELKQGLCSQPWDAFESTFKRITDVPTVIAKAKISSLLLPVAVATIFASRNAKEELKKQEEQSKKSSAKAKSEEKFKNFGKVTSPNKNPLSFTGSILNSALDGSTRLFEKFSISRTGEGMVKAVSKCAKKPSHLMSQIESIGITIYWLLNTHFSKKIDPDQKLGLNIHTALVTIISSFLSYVIDTVSDGLIDKAQASYGNKINEIIADAKAKAKTSTSNKNIIQTISDNSSNLYNSKEIVKAISNEGVLENEALIKEGIAELSKKYSKHLSKFKSLMIFTLVVRFLVPVLTVKQSKKLKKHLVNFSKKRAEKEQGV